jgi:uncharacterized protein (DUF488 family)
MPPLILTVGHSTHAPDDFLGLLEGAGVELVADVRMHPGSRRMPHFGADALAEALAGREIGYLHLRELGGRRRPQANSPNGAWESDAFRGYADHMASAEFAAGLERLEAAARARRTAVMCAEAPWWRCHRRLLADVLAVRGWDVRHLMPDGVTRPHELPPFAVEDRGRVLYPPAQGSLDVPAV